MARKVKNHGPSIKNDKKYEALRREGASKQKAARIANTPTAKTASAKRGKASHYEDWPKSELYGKAKDLHIAGRSKMSKAELIRALRAP